MSDALAGTWIAATYGDPDRDALLDLLDFADMAARLVTRGADAYQEDETLRLAAEAVTHRIGEAVGRLSEAFVAQHPSVPWRQIRAMRNLVAHNYGRIDHTIVWNTMLHDVPELARYCRGLLER